MTTTTTYRIKGKASFRSKISRGACSACVVARRLHLFFLLSILFTACGHEDLVMPDEYVEENSPYVEIRIAVPFSNPSATRANPMGGEEGNGREKGILNEDIVHDINIFFYLGSNGLDSPDDTKIKMHFYYNLENNNDPLNSKLWYDDEKVNGNEVDENGNPKYYPYYKNGYYIIKLRCSEEEFNLINENNGVDFAAVANLGPIDLKSDLTLGELRDASFLKYYNGNSWTSTADVFSLNARNMDYFLMSTAYNKNYNYGTDRQPTGNNKIEKNGDEYIGTTTLQRLYARLDLWYNKDKNAILKKKTEGGQEVSYVDELLYPVDNTEADIVYLTNILPVNVMQSPSYLFKKVTYGLNSFTRDDIQKWSSFRWGGKEDPFGIPVSNPDRPANYVIERHTTDKKANGQTPETTLYEWYGSSNVKQVKMNIASGSHGRFSNYYDGVQLKGEYDDDYGCNHISIISYANENTHPTDCFSSNYLTGMAFRAVYVPEKIYSGYSVATDENGKIVDNFENLNNDDASIDGGLIYRYSKSAAHDDNNLNNQLEKDCIYFSSESAAKAYSSKHPEDLAVITSYVAEKHNGKWGFICYYNLWLRHYNDVNDAEPSDPHEHLPMEYATVRNNIYRVAVSFSGPGDPSPTMREPDTMKARIFVRKWNYREEDTIIF